MQQSTFEFIADAHDAFDSRSINPSVFQPNIYDQLRTKRGYDQPVYYIYFYYISITADGRLEVRHYHYHRSRAGRIEAIDYDDVDGILAALMQNAVDGQHNPAPETAINFRNVEWGGRSYIAIAVNEPYWTLYQRQSRNSPITFLPRMKDGRRGTSNHTFFDARDLKLPVRIDGSIETRSAIFFINHYKKNTQADPISSRTDTQHFHFNIYFDVAFSAGTDPALTVIFDPGGTNQGPALYP